MCTDRREETGLIKKLEKKDFSLTLPINNPCLLNNESLKGTQERQRMTSGIIIKCRSMDPDIYLVI